MTKSKAGLAKAGKTRDIKSALASVWHEGHNHKLLLGGTVSAGLMVVAFSVPMASGSTAHNQDQTKANLSNDESSARVEVDITSPMTDGVAGANEKLSIDANMASPRASSDMSNTNVSLDDRRYKVPADGSLHKVVNTKNGKTKIDVSSESSGSGNNSTSFDIEVSTKSNIYQSKQTDSSP